IINYFRTDIYYGMGSELGWHNLSRNLFADLKMSFPKRERVTFSRHVNFSLSGLELRGSGRILNLKLTNNIHSQIVFQVSDWLVKNQDQYGGWPIPVERKFPGLKKKLKPGWYSSMGQGHAMSLLSRSFETSRDLTYLRAAFRAATPFLVAGKDGGVLAYLFGKLPWYEEYPTVPSTFVLNGFMYALFGLYDLAVTLENLRFGGEALSDDVGMRTLGIALPLFDTGSGSFYDLNHFTHPGVTPNLARWDYHTTHINQFMMASIVEVQSVCWKVFNKFINRWSKYLKGFRAEHN
ncbi:hypothetical protein HELRODRAFT_142574, partial [Helobdella robusta]|uniref:D-glucuronyl C5-epimerase C-terminal domain-containing protein n=1 Tax=Helobdella robusta TaxID=6412 RepID=T1EJ62_HELRO